MTSALITYRILVASLLTATYGLSTIKTLLSAYSKDPNPAPWEITQKFEPECLNETKYGVHKYIKANNITFHYVDSGNASNPAILFIHGYPEFWYSWRHQIPFFNPYFRCIAMDMRGYGDTEKPEGISQYKLEILVEDIRDFIKQLGYEKIIIVGQDWGGAVALRCRDMYPEMVKALVLISSTSLEGLNKQIWTTEEQRNMSSYIFEFQMPTVPELELQSYNISYFDETKIAEGKNGTTAQDVECYKYWFSKKGAFTSALNYYRANFDYEWQINYHNEDVPFLAVHGRNDTYLSTSLLGVLNESYSHIKPMILEDFGHMMHIAESATINNIIEDFLSENNLWPS